MQLQSISRIAPFVTDAPCADFVQLPRQASAGSGRLVRWWRRRVERARRAAERRELLALGEAGWRDLGICRALEEARKPAWRP